MELQIQLPKIVKKKKKQFLNDFNEELVKVKLMILTMEDVNIDVSEEKNEINALEEKINTKDFDEVELNPSLINIYQDMTNKLISIEKRLEKYGKLVLLKNKISYLENAIKSEEANKDLQKFIKLSIEILKSLKELNPSIISKNKEYYEEVYKVIYEFIKLELALTLESETLKELTKDISGIYYIDKLIREDIEEIQSYSYTENIKLIDRLNMMKNGSTSQTLSSNIVNKDVIISILLIKQKEKLLNSFQKSLNDIESNYNENLQNIEDLMGASQKRIEENIKEQEESLKKSNKELKKKLFSIALSLAVVFAIGKNIPSFSEYANTKVVTTTEIYEEGKEPVSLTSYEFTSKEITRILEIYGISYKNSGQNFCEKRTYDVTNVIIEDGVNQDYLNIDVEKFDLKEIKTAESIELESPTFKEIRKLTVVTSDLDNPNNTFDENAYKSDLKIFYAILVLASFTKIGPINLLIQIIKKINTYDKITDIINLLVEENENLLKECKKYIHSNEDLEKTYYSIMNGEIKYLTDQEIEDKIKDLIKRNSEYKRILKNM